MLLAVELHTCRLQLCLPSLHYHKHQQRCCLLCRGAESVVMMHSRLPGALERARTHSSTCAMASHWCRSIKYLLASLERSAND